MNLRIACKITNNKINYQNRKGCYHLVVKAAKLRNRRTKQFLNIDYRCYYCKVKFLYWNHVNVTCKLNNKTCHRCKDKTYNKEQLATYAKRRSRKQ